MKSTTNQEFLISMCVPVNLLVQFSSNLHQSVHTFFLLHVSCGIIKHTEKHVPPDSASNFLSEHHQKSSTERENPSNGDQ